MAKLQTQVVVNDPVQPKIDVSRMKSIVRNAMLQEGRKAKKILDEDAKLHQASLKGVFDPLRQGRSQKSLPRLPRSTRELLGDADRRVAAAKADAIQKNLIASELRAGLSPRMASCVTAWAPHTHTYVDPHGGGIGGISSHVDASAGRFAGYTFLAVGGSMWLGTGVGEWVYSGANAGWGSATANTRVYGRCAEYSALFGYFRNSVKVHVRTWDAAGVQHDAQNTVHDNWEVIGLNIRDFSGDSFNPTVNFPIRSNTWYFVWAWAEQYTVCGGLADGGTNLWMYTNGLRICV